MDPPFRFFVSISYLLGSVNAGGDTDCRAGAAGHRLVMTGLQEQRCRPGSGRPGGRPLRASTVKCSVGAAAHIGPAAPALKISVGRDAHIAPHGRRRGLPPSRQGSTSAERVADGDAETMRKQGAKFAHPDTRGREDRCRRHLSRGKDFKALVLTAFFPPFLSPKKERGPPEAQRRGYGLPRRCRRSPARNDGLQEIQANNSRRVFHILLTTAKNLL